MDERTWLNRVWAMAEQFGWKCWHFAAPMRSSRTGGFVGDARGAGLPDLVLIHDDPPRLIFAELKGEGGRLSERQQQFLQAAQRIALRTGDRFDEHWAGPIGVYAWWPKDEAVVEQILRSKVLA